MRRLLDTTVADRVLGGLAASRVIASLVWGQTGADPISIVATMVLLLLVGLQACLWPALKATRVNPIVALRAE